MAELKLGRSRIARANMVRASELLTALRKSAKSSKNPGQLLQLRTAEKYFEDRKFWRLMNYLEPSRVIERIKIAQAKIQRSSQPKTLNQYLCLARLKSGKTQMDAAKFIGHSTAQYISNLERGLCEASPEMAIRLCEFYGGNRKALFDFMVATFEANLKAQFKKAR